jgi:hypothetical protein
MLDVEQRTAILRWPLRAAAATSSRGGGGLAQHRQARAEVRGQAVPAASPRAEQARPPFAAHRGALHHLRGKPRARPRGARRRGDRARYSTLTALLPRHGIGVVAEGPRRPLRLRARRGDAARHLAAPGGDRRRQERVLQCASLVLCHSRMIFAQVYPRVGPLLVQGLPHRGAPLLRRRRRAVHARQLPRGPRHGHRQERRAGAGDGGLRRALRLRLRRPRGRRTPSARGASSDPSTTSSTTSTRAATFADVPDLNAQLRAWCDQKNALFKPRLRAAPVTLFALERPALAPLPVHVPEVERSTCASSTARASSTSTATATRRPSRCSRAR